MEDYSFDRFLSGLRNAMVHAQESGRRRYRQSMLRRFGSDEDAVTTFSVPTLDREGWRTVDIPLTDLLHCRYTGISEIDIEIGCELRRIPSVKGGRPDRVVASVGSRGKTRHTLRITLKGLDAPTCEVRVDGIRLRRRAEESRHAAPGTSPQTVR